MKEILEKLKKELPYDGSIKDMEEEMDCILLLAIQSLIKNPSLVEFKDGKFVCAEDAPIELKVYVSYRNKKHK